VPEMHYVVFDKQRENLPVVLEPGKINLKIYKDSIRASKVTGTKSNDDFTDYKLKTKDFYSELTKIQNEIRTANFMKDTILINDLTSQFESLRSKLLKYEESFVVENNDSYLSSLILQRMLMNQEIELEKIESYFERFTDIIKNTKSSIESKKRIDELNKAKENQPTIGSLAPDFSGPSLDGTSISLSDVKSKVILLDFWASWCAPCRVENPSLVNLKKKYSNKDFEIVGVSLDRDRESWVNAIENDKIKNWVHVSNLKFWGEPIAKLYKVIKMPTTFVLDENKNVIGIDVKGDDLDNLIAQQLAK
jgi:thiol-disulfide isomerase/thioredoxin